MPQNVLVMKNCSDNMALVTTMCDQSDMKEEVFQHRLGARPTIESVLSLISIFEEEKLGEFAVDENAQCQMNIVEKDLEATVLDNLNYLALSQVLHDIGSFGKEPWTMCSSESDPAGDITAK